MLRPESAAEQCLRSEVRAWLRANTPDELRHLAFRPVPREIMPWYRRLFGRGWIAPHWPLEHGGMGASPVEQVILIEEMASFGAPDIPSQGINQIGPLLITRSRARGRTSPGSEGAGAS
jgi:alkylation response protein AidB-like acyl-CoA dehydrogenase